MKKTTNKKQERGVKMYEMLAFFMGLAILIGFWLYKSLRIVGASEAAIITTFGKPEKAVGSGLAFAPYPFCGLIVFPTTREELEFDTKILTKKDRGHSAVNVRVHLSLRFRYPARENAELPHLLHTVKVISSLDRKYLTSLFMEPVVDLVEEVCQGFNWERLYHDRNKFNQEMVNELNSLAPDNILVESQIVDVNVLLTNLELPPELEAAISKPESATLESEAEAIKIRKIAAANADAKRLDAAAEKKRVEDVYSAIHGGSKVTKEDGRAIRQMEAFEEAAKGESNMIISVPELSEFASAATGLAKKLVKTSK